MSAASSSAAIMHFSSVSTKETTKKKKTGPSQVLFSPSHMVVFVFFEQSPRTLQANRIDCKIRVEIRDMYSAWLVFYNNEEGHVDEVRLVLDLACNLYREEEEVGEDGTLQSMCFRYVRFDEMIRFQLLPMSDRARRNLQAFDFVLGQYATKEDRKFDDRNTAGSRHRKPNVIATGLEDTGVVVRHALRSGGRYTGHVIRYLGETYTSLVAPKDSDSRKIAFKDIDPKILAKAQKRKKWAEGFHSGARTVTGTALYPVRWTGRKASEWARAGTEPPKPPGTITKAVYDTVGGLGNGVMSICKGFTEALGEVGSAIGDSALHHSKTCYGEEYAEAVTKCYVEAASEIGLASYKVVNVAAFGFVGLTIDAVVEGLTLLVALYDYLIGPVLLQGYMDMIQLPLTRPERFFVVLRPWSIAFYKSSKDFVKKPYKILVTSMLDTLPKLRRREAASCKPSPAAVVLQDEAAVRDETVSEAVQEKSLQGVEDGEDAELGEEEVEDIEASNEIECDLPASPGKELPPVLSVSSANASSSGQDVLAAGREEDQEGGELALEILESEGVKYIVRPQQQEAAPANPSWAAEEEEEEEEVKQEVKQEDVSPVITPKPKKTTKAKFTQVLKNWNGGNRSHIELCTVDCSTFLLYPEEDVIDEWFEELKQAGLRVETIAKRKSGAEELALRRRLAILPKSKILRVEVQRFVLAATRKHNQPPSKATPSNKSAAASETIVEENHDDEEEEEKSKGGEEAVNEGDDGDMLDFEEEYEMDDFYFEHVSSEGSSPNPSESLPPLSAQNLALSELRQLHNPHRLNLDAASMTSSWVLPSNGEDSSHLRSPPEEEDAEEDSCSAPSDVLVASAINPTERVPIAPPTVPEDEFALPAPIVVQDVDLTSEVSCELSSVRSHRNRSSTSSTLGRSINRHVQGLTAGLKKSMDFTAEQFIELSLVPKTKHGVLITSEEVHTEPVVVMKVGDHIQHLRNAFRRMPSSSSPQPSDASNVLANATFVIEEDSESVLSVDAFPQTADRAADEPVDRKLGLCRHLELFHRIDENKSIAEWEFSPEIKGEIPVASTPARALAIPDSDYRRRNEVEVPLIPLTDPQLPPSNNTAAANAAMRKNMNVFELGHKASLFHAHDSCSIEIQVRSKVRYSALELGHGSITIEDLDSNNGAQDLWVPVIHKKSGRQVGSLALRLQVYQPR